MKNKECINNYLKKYNLIIGCYSEKMSKLSHNQIKSLLKNIGFICGYPEETHTQKIKINKKYYLFEYEQTCFNESDFTIKDLGYYE